MVYMYVLMIVNIFRRLSSIFLIHKRVHLFILNVLFVHMMNKIANKGFSQVLRLAFSLYYFGMRIFFCCFRYAPAHRFTTIYMYSRIRLQISVNND